MTAGPTHEPIDPVRYLGNRSSGKMGFSIARAAAQRGAEVTLIAGPVVLPTPPHVHRIDVTTAREMHEAVLPGIHHDGCAHHGGGRGGFCPGTDGTAEDQARSR